MEISYHIGHDEYKAKPFSVDALPETAIADVRCGTPQQHKQNPSRGRRGKAVS